MSRSAYKAILFHFVHHTYIIKNIAFTDMTYMYSIVLYTARWVKNHVQKTEGFQHKINTHIEHMKMKIDTSQPNDIIILHEWH